MDQRTLKGPFTGWLRSDAGLDCEPVDDGDLGTDEKRVWTIALITHLNMETRPRLRGKPCVVGLLWSWRLSMGGQYV